MAIPRKKGKLKAEVKSYEFRKGKLENCADIRRYGVYVLVWKHDKNTGSVVYVGRAKNVQDRVENHRTSTNLSGWDYAYAVVSNCFHATIINELEAKLIEYMTDRGRLRKRQRFKFEKQIGNNDSRQVDVAYGAVRSLIESDDNLSTKNDSAKYSSGKRLSIQVMPRRAYISLEEIGRDLSHHDMDDITISRAEEVFKFCANCPGVTFVKRSDKRHLRYAAAVGTYNFCILDVMKGRVRLNIALEGAERDADCKESKFTSDKFCKHELEEGGLTEYLKCHIRKAYEIRTTIKRVPDREKNIMTDSQGIKKLNKQQGSLTGEEAVKHARSKLSHQLPQVFDVLVGHLHKLRPLEIKWREDNQLNFAKKNGSGVPSTAILAEPRSTEIRVHLYFERQSPLRRDERLERSSKDGDRALHLDITREGDVDDSLLAHIDQVWRAH